MAEALRFMADEVGRAFALIWGGVGIAAKLNYEVMSVVITITTRIVHLLLLLTQKTAELFHILANDILLFVGDIGTGVIAMSNTMADLINGIINAIGIIGTSCVAAVYHVCSLIGSIHTSIIGGFVGLVNQVGHLLQLAKSGIILFGSSVLFAISFLPKLVYLLVSSLVNTMVNFYLRSILFVQNSIFSCKHLMKVSGSLVWNFFSDIPIQAVLGACLGVVLIIGVKYLVQFMVDNLILIPDFPTPSFITNLRGRMMQWYMRVWREANRPPRRENSTDEETLDDEEVEVEARPQQRNPEPPVSLPGSPSSSGLNRTAHSYLLPPLRRRPIRHRTFGLGSDVTEEEVSEATASNKSKDDTTNKAGNTQWVRQLYKELEDEKEGKLCIICQDRPKRVILLPCRHLCLCDSCRSAVITRDNSCPICRKPILDSLRVYL